MSLTDFWLRRIKDGQANKIALQPIFQLQFLSCYRLFFAVSEKQNCKSQRYPSDTVAAEK